MRSDLANASTTSRWVLLAFLVALAPSAHAATLYGDVEFVEGSTEILDATGKVRKPRTGEKVYEGETMRTGEDGEMHVRTGDHGLVALRSNTRIKVEIYRADGDDEDRSVLSLLTGTLRSISGWIGKYQSKSYAIKTNNATVGIRGTDHEPLYIAPGEKASAAPGTYDKVNAGSTYIETAAGRVTVEKGRAGFAPHDPKAAPRLLDKVPEVYRPTKNEERIRKRKEELEREVEKARLERQKAKAAEKTGQAEKAPTAAENKAETGEKAEKGDASKSESSKAEAAKDEARKKAAERRRHRPESK